MPSSKSRTRHTDGLIHQGVVLHFMLQLSLTEDADARLRRRGMGRVHHRILYFVHFCPGITIKEILSVLDVRHQNIQPSLRHLISQGYLAPRADAGDARIKRLYTSRKGDKLLEFIGLNQRARFARGFQSVASRDVLSYFKVMISMLDPDRRAWADRLTRLDDPSRIV